MITKNKCFIAINRQSVSAMNRDMAEVYYYTMFNRRFTTIADNPELINRYFALC